MLHPLHIGTRRLLTVIFWAVLVAGLLREGAEWALRQSLVRILHVSAPDAQFHLLKLSVESDAGEGVWHGVGVRWEGIRINLLTGGGMDLFELGPAIAPVLRARNMTFTRVWPLVSGNVMRVEVSPFRPEWGRFAGEGAAGTPWELDVPFHLHARQVSADTPWGHWQGPASLEGEGTGRQGRWSAELAKGEGRFEARGGWSAEGLTGEATLKAADSNSAHGSFDWGRKGTYLRLDGGEGGEHWTADVQSGESQTLQVSIARGAGMGKPGQTLSFQVEPGKGAGAWPQIANVAGRVLLPEIKLGGGMALLDGRISADPQGAAEPGQTCVALLLTGRLVLPERSFILRSTLIARGVAGHAAEGLVEGSASPVPRPLLEEPPPVAFWRISASKDGAGERLVALFHAGASLVEASASSMGEGWRWDGAWTFPSGSAKLVGRWSAGRWSSSGSFDFRRKPPLAADWVLPSPPLTGTFGLEGSEEGLSRLNLDARGSGLWQSTLTPAGWKVQVRGGAVEGAGIALSGLDLTVLGRGPLNLSLGGNFRADLSAEDFKLGHQDLGRLGARLSSDGKRGALLKADAELKFLDGRCSFDAAAKRVGGDLTLSNAQVSLVGGAVQFSDVSASWSGRPEDPAAWKAGRAKIYGEGVQRLQGHCTVAPGLDGVILDGSGSHWGGEVTGRLPLGSSGRPLLRLDAKGVDGAPVPPYIRQWVELPLTVGSGKLSGSVLIDLDNAVEGLAIDVDLAEVDIRVPDETSVLPKCTGRFHGLLSGGAFDIPEASMAIDGGKVPTTFALHSDGTGTRFSFATPTMEAERLQKAAFDFLPESLGYATFKGTAAASGRFTAADGQMRMDLVLRAEKLEYMSEDKSLRLRGVTGTAPIPLNLGGREPDLSGYQNPARVGHLDAFRQLAHVPASAGPLVIDRLRYSVFSADALRLYSRVDDGVLSLWLTDADLWGGHLRGAGRFALSSDGIRYAAQLLGRDLSLRAFCEQSGALKDFISGTAEASVTLGGDGIGATRAKALAEVWVNPDEPEPRVISRDFLVKMGGEKIRSLLHSDILEYDKAALTCGLSGGTLSVYELDLSHRANPLKALMRKDVSFEVRVPQRNSISLDQLAKNIKNLEVQAGIGKAHPPKRKGGR
jgi:hypothetical protein